MGNVFFFLVVIFSCFLFFFFQISKSQNPRYSKITRNIDRTSDSRHLVADGIKITNLRSRDFANALWHHRNIDKTSESRHLVVEGIKITNLRSRDFANALWHHRNIDKTSESRHLVVEGIKITNLRSPDFANALWHHRNIDKTSESRHLVVEGIKITNLRSPDFANALWHHRNIDKTSESRHLVVEGIKIQDSTSKIQDTQKSKKCNSSRARSLWSVVTFLYPLPPSPLLARVSRTLKHLSSKSSLGLQCKLPMISDLKTSRSGMDVRNRSKGSEIRLVARSKMFRLWFQAPVSGGPKHSHSRPLVVEGIIFHVSFQCK